MAKWTVKKASGEIYGPVDLTDIVDWAQEGRIASEDELSNDQQAWQSPATVPELGMQYEILLDDQSTYGPIHVLVLGELLLEGDIQATTRVRHTSTNEVRSATSWLIPHLIQRHSADATEIDALKATVDSLRLRLEQAEAKVVEHTEDVPVDLRDVPRETLKWQRLHESEKKDRLRTEEQLKRQIAELKADLQTAYSDRDRLLYRASQAERLYRQITGEEDQKKTVAGSSLPAHSDAEETHQQLLENYEKLLEQMQQKNQEIEQLRQIANQPAGQDEKKIAELKAELETERNNQSDIRARLAELEATHASLLKDYREMNDRFIRLRDQVQ